MECPIKTPVKVIGTNGTIANVDDNMFLKILFRGQRDFELKMQKLRYVAKAINSHEKLVKLLKDAQRYIRAKDPKYIEIEQVLKEV